MPQYIQHNAQLEAFCSTCPTPEEVTVFLETLGFRLGFKMKAYCARCNSQVPMLPAQYHYEREDGSEVIFLAGRDADPDGVRLPEHASRFWIYPGADAGAARWAASMLAVKWSFVWQSVSPARQNVACPATESGQFTLVCEER